MNLHNFDHLQNQNQEKQENLNNNLEQIHVINERMKNRSIRDLQPISFSSLKKRWKIDLEQENYLSRVHENQVLRNLRKNQSKVKTDQLFEWLMML